MNLRGMTLPELVSYIENNIKDNAYQNHPITQALLPKLNELINLISDYEETLQTIDEAKDHSQELLAALVESINK